MGVPTVWVVGQETELERANQGAHMRTMRTPRGQDGARVKTKQAEWRGLFPSCHISEQNPSYVTKVSKFRPGFLDLTDLTLSSTSEQEYI